MVEPNDEIRDTRSEIGEPEQTVPALDAGSEHTVVGPGQTDVAPLGDVSQLDPSQGGLGAATPWWWRPDDAAAVGGTAPIDPLTASAAWEIPDPQATSAYNAPLPDAASRRGGRRGAAALLVAAVVVSAAASGVVVHLVDDHSTTGVAATAATAPVTSASSSTSNLPQPAQVASDVKSALAKIEPSVVLINDTITGAASGRGGFGGFQESGAGTGIVISADGLVVTNAHVVNGATDIQVSLPNNGGTHAASIVGIDVSQDLAVIKVAGVSNLKAATFANSDSTEVGDNVLAVGNALGYGGAPTVTEGILSAKGRSLHGTSDSLTNLLQTDAAINPGNSGGPLTDASGQVIGINVAVASGSATEPAQNIGFAIPSNTVVSALPALKAGAGAGTQATPGTTQSGTYLGVSVADANPGALIESVQQGSPADGAGLQAGDVITAIDGKAVADGGALQQVIRADKSGTTVTLSVTRNGGTSTIKVKLGTTQLSS
jgi:S1-C subfamily serine protease